MIEQTAKRIANHLRVRGKVSDEQIDMTAYGLEIMLGRLITVGSVAILSMLIRQPVTSLVFTAFFIILRKKAGGYHAPSHLSCYLSFTAVYLVGQLLIPALVLIWSLLSHIMSIIAVLLVIYLAPIAHPDSILRKDDLSKLRRDSLVVLGALVLIQYLLYVAGAYSLFCSSAFGLFASASLLGVAKIKNQEARYD